MPTYKFNVITEDGTVDLKSLTEEEQAEISEKLTERIADIVAVGMARQQAV
jgi:uncharacterized protein YoaH (UPF0181 family)